MEHRVKSLSVIAVLVAAVAVTLSPRRPSRKVLCEGFLPKNNMKIPVGDVRALGIDEVTFNKVLDRIQEVYGPIVAAHGATLQINRLWDDPTVNASAEQNGNTWILNMYGGLARHRAVNYDGMMLVACHEMGHHLGGQPLFNGGDWASNEGEADYFGVTKCLRKTLGTKSVENLDPFAKAACDKAWGADADGKKKCYVAAEAGYALADLLGELGGTGTPQYNTPDTSVVAQTNDEHPAAQCRLDTYFQGGQCTKSENVDFSRTSARPGACNQAEGATVGYRPQCWYHDAEGLTKDQVALAAPKPIDVKTVEAQLKSLRAALSGGR